MKLLLSLFVILAFVAPQIYAQNSTSCNGTVPVTPPPPPPTTVPAAPIGFSNINNGAGTGGVVTFVWKAASDASSYTLSWTVGSGWYVYASNITGTTYDMGLNPMSTYTISLTPTNVFGNGDSATVVIQQRQTKIS